MEKLDKSLLDSLSLKLVQRLLEQYPDWERFAKTAAVGDGSDWAVEFNVPNLEADRFLWIDTHTIGGEVTIAFSGWHTHENSWLEDIASEIESNIVERTLALVHGILSEQLVVVVMTDQDGNYAGSRMRNAVEPVYPEPRVTLQVSSWCGTYDRVVSE